VINAPYVDNRPIRLRASTISQRELSNLCEKYSISFFDSDDLQPIVDEFNWEGPVANRNIEQLNNWAKKSGCQIVR